MPGCSEPDLTPAFAGETFAVAVYAHALRSTPDLVGEVAVGASLRDMGAGVSVAAWVDGALQADPDYRPRAGQHVLLRATLQGGDGGGKMALRLVATIAITVASYGAAGALASSAGAGSLVGASAGSVAALGAGLSAIGNLAFNALVPPPSPSLAQDDPFSFKPENSLTGVRNTLAPMAPIPRVYGKHPIYPPLAARPYTEQTGAGSGEQYLYLVLALGYGPLEIPGVVGGVITPAFFTDNAKIGDTALSEFEIADEDIRLHDGSAPAELEIFTRNAVEDAVNVEFTQDAESVTRSTDPDARSVSLEFWSPLLLEVNREGRKDTAAVALQVEIRPSGGGAWTNVTPGAFPGLRSLGALAWSGDYPIGIDPWLETSPGQPWDGGVTQFDGSSTGDGPSFFLWGRDKDPKFGTLQFDLPAAGQYDVRVTRRRGLWARRRDIPARNPAWTPVRDAYSSPEFEGNDSGWGVFNRFFWRTLRSIRSEQPIKAPGGGLALLELRIKATNQLSGTLDNLSVIVQSILPVWNGSAWVDAPTSNPAAIYRDILTGSANARALPVARLDNAALAQWADECAAAGYEFNAPFDGRTTVHEALSVVAAAGRASPTIRDGLFSVVRDVQQSTPVQVFSPRNSWGFTGSRSHTPLPHALKVRFKDRDRGWAQAERLVYADGYSADGTGCLNPGPGGSCETATTFETLTLTGETSEEMAGRHGRYHLAVAALRPESFEFEADIENVVCQRGDRIELQHDSILVGLGAGRITAQAPAANPTSITLDERVVLEPTKNYGVRIRRADGTQITRAVTNAAGETATLMLGSAATAAQPGDLVLFGEVGLETFSCLVKTIEPGGDLTARITAVPYNVAIYSADSGPLPPYDPGVSEPASLPVAPTLTVLRGRLYDARGVLGMQLQRIVVSYRFAADSPQPEWVDGRIRVAGQGPWRTLPRQTAGESLAFLDFDADETYEVAVRGIGSGGLAGPWGQARSAPTDELIGEIASIGLIEQPDNPATPNQDLSTIVATVPTPEDPTDPGFPDPSYSHALVEFRRVDQAAWFGIGPTDENGQARVVVNRDGTTYEFRARAVSAGGVTDVDGPTAQITVSVEDGLPPGGDPDAGATPDAALNVSNLRVSGAAPGDGEFAGRDLRLAWDAVIAPAGQTLRDYRVRILDPDDSSVMRVMYVVGAQATYTFQQNSEDSAREGSGPRRALRVEVVARTGQGGISETPATITATNPPPELPGDFSAAVFYSAIELNYGVPADPDYDGVSVYLSDTQGFTPGPDTLVYHGDRTLPIVIDNLQSGQTYYYRLVLRDLFGPGPASLEFTATMQGLPWNDVDPPLPPSALTLRSEVQQTELTVTAALIAEWEPGTDNSGKLYYEIEYWELESEVTADTRSAASDPEVYALAMFTGTETVGVGFANDGAGEAFAGALFRDSVVGTSYTVFPARVGRRYAFRVRSVDYSGNKSDWLGPAEHTIEGDDVPPATPTGATAVGGIDKVTVRWTNPADADWLQTRVHRGADAGFTPAPSNLRATTRADTFVDTEVAADTSYFYKLVALDVADNASAPTAAIGPAQAVKFNPVNIADFMAPGTIAETQLTASFVERVDAAEAAIDDNVDQINAIQAQLADILALDDFDSGNSYAIGDLVVYDGAIYRAIDDMPTPPAPLPTDTDYWEKIGNYSSLGEAVAANSAAISVLQTDVTNAEGGIATNAAAITGLISDISNLETGQAAQGTAITNLQTTVTQQGDDIAANAAAVSAVSAELDDTQADVAANANAIDVLESTVTQQGDDIAANAVSITQLTADLTAPVFALKGGDGGEFVFGFADDGDGEAAAAGARTATSEIIDTLQVTVAQQGDTLVSQGTAITGLQSGLADAEANIAGNASALGGLTTTVTLQGDQIAVNASAITALEASLSDAEGNITANASAISGLTTTVSNQGGQISAISASVTTLQTQVGSNTAAISTQQASINGIEANWSVRANVNGRVTGIGLIAGGTETVLGVLVDRFVIVDPDDNDGFAPFEVSGGNVYIKTAFIRNLDAGQITSGSIATARLTTNVLAALQANVTTLSAIRADLGEVTAGTITGLLIRTSAAFPRIEFASTFGFRARNAAEQTTAHVRVDGSGYFGIGGNAISWNTDGQVTIPGTLIAGDIVGNTIKTGTSGWRVEIGPSLTGSTVLRYTNGTDTRLSLDQTGNLTLTGTITGSTVRTGAGNPRVEMSAAGGFQSINASGQIRAHFRVDGSGFVGLHPSYGTPNYINWGATGGLEVVGTTITGGLFRTSSGGQRAEMSAASNDLRFYDSTNTLRALVGDASSIGVTAMIYARGSGSIQAASFVNNGTAAACTVVQQSSGNALLVTGSGSAGDSDAVMKIEATSRGLWVRNNAFGARYQMCLPPLESNVPTHTAPGGSFVTRIVGGNEAALYYQRAHPSGSNWVRID
ncbi:MAG: host specificity factor TipJ family phage tail protein [Sinimarinibacterium flocculans]|uniref:host specificity factor TipJ family phage tail protein n=1 Tax=Sinimarinibacterium flocculans TaxID=985250 RepID=UPI003C53D69E